MPKAKKPTTRKTATPAKATAGTVAARPPEVHGGIIGGLTLVALGAVFLIQSYTSFQLDNAWALLLLLPTVAAWTNAYWLYQRNRHVGRRTWSAFMGGLVPAVVAVIFLNNLDWSKIWPVFLILAGMSAMGPRGRHPHDAAQ